MTESQRYSEKRLKDSFSVYLLFSEPIKFFTAEILTALREDYPELVWTDTLGMNLPVDTGQFGMGEFFAEKSDVPQPGVVHFMTNGKRCEVDWDDVLLKSRFVFEDGADAVRRHQTYLCISLDSTDTSLASRFDAARRITCLGALFAKLPICLGVYFPSADMLVPAHRWVEAADEAIKEKVPFFQWIMVLKYPAPDGREPVPLSVQTLGLAAFTGTEIILPAARVSSVEALKWVHSATTMVLEYGHEFKDSNTIGPEDTDEKLRIRFWPEGHMGAQTDMWALIHPNYSRDEISDFGPRTGEPPPPGYDNTIKGQEGWLRQKIGLFTSPRSARPN